MNMLQTRLIAWFKFAAGLCLLLLMISFFASGYAPPGFCGEVLRHNQANSVDASPLFYSDVENMFELEAGVQEMVIRASLHQQ